MKKKTCMILSLAALTLLGCNKEGTQGVTSPAAQPMLFSASNVQTKAVFAAGDDGTLEWSAYDNLGVYSFNGAALVHNGFASMKNYTGSEAVFSSADSRATWAGSADNLTFYAYYPQLSAPEAGYNTGTGKVSLNVPTTQNGEFGKYHICYASTDISAEDLTAGDPVNFEFSPKTSMIRIRPIISAESDIDEIKIRQVIITIADDKSIAGDCSLALATGALTADDVTSAITVKLDEAVTITKTAASNPYFTAVLLPSVTDNAVLSFYALAADGTRFNMARKLSPAQFQPGMRYNVDRKITVSVSDAPDAQYVDGGYAWGYIPVEEDGAYTDGGYAW